MQIHFKTTGSDYQRFLKLYFFKRNLPARLLLLLLIAASFGWIGNMNPFVLSVFILRIIATVVLVIVFGLAFYLIARIKLKKSGDANGLNSTQTMTTTDEGIVITSANGDEFWKWEALDEADILDGWLFVKLNTKKFYILPPGSFATGNDAGNFLGVLKTAIQKFRGKSKPRTIRNLYYWGLAGIVPNFGVIIGIVLIIKGFRVNKIAVMLLGIGDILFTILFWTIIVPIDPVDFKQASQRDLNSLVRNIEFYKLQHGEYPDSLQQLLNEDKFAPIYDYMQVAAKKSRSSVFNYKKTGDKYMLFSSGVDGIPNTRDDLFPMIKIDSGKIGLVQPE